MPNWCNNYVTLTGPKEKIDELIVEMQKSDDAKTFYEILNKLRPNPAGEWDYDWSVENWGTKWDVNLAGYEVIDETTVSLSFDSAWSPPIALYDYLTEQGWEVNALYHEPGMAYCGTYTSEDGDDYYEYDITDAESIENLPQELVEFGGLEDAHRDWMIDNLSEEWGDAERTEWYDASVKPSRIGYYEITTAGWDFPQFCEWNGDHWISYNEVKQWRGLAQDPSWDPVAELDKIVSDEEEVD